MQLLNSFQWHSPLPLMITHYDTIHVKTELISFCTEHFSIPGYHSHNAYHHAVNSSVDHTQYTGTILTYLFIPQMRNWSCTTRTPVSTQGASKLLILTL